MKLNNLKINEEATIKKIKGDKSFVNRIINMGFSLNSKVKCVLISPFKDPKGYLINNVLIAIRNKDAENIEVSYE